MGEGEEVGTMMAGSIREKHFNVLSLGHLSSKEIFCYQNVFFIHQMV